MTSRSNVLSVASIMEVRCPPEIGVQARAACCGECAPARAPPAYTRRRIGPIRRDIYTRAMALVLDLPAGLSGTAELVVGEQHTAPRIGSGRIRVLATPVMINLIEAAALAALENSLPEEHQSLGTHLDITHVAATPVGMRVRATAEVLRVEGRTVYLKVRAEDERELIGEGTHERVVVNVARFDKRVQDKLAK